MPEVMSKVEAVEKEMIVIKSIYDWWNLQNVKKPILRSTIMR